MKKALAFFKSKKSKKDAKSASFARTQPPQQVIPDAELHHSFEAIKLLGHGCTGQTWLCRETSTQELVAVKLIPRPFSKALLPSQVEREIKVSARISLAAAEWVSYPEGCHLC